MTDQNPNVPEPEVHPVGAPKKNPLATAAAAARQRLSEGGTLEPETHTGGTRPVADEAVEEDAIWQDEPVDPSTESLQPGTDPVADAEAEPEVPEPEEVPVEGPEDEELEDEPEAEADDELEDAEDAEGEEGEEDAEEDDGVFALELPGRRPGDPDMEIQLEGLEPEEQEAFNRMKNGYMRGEEMRQRESEINDLRVLLNEATTKLKHDPVGFVIEDVTPEVQKDLARHLLSQPEIFEDVVEDVAIWHRNPEKRELAQARLELERREHADQAQRQIAAYKQSRQSAKMITETVDALVPEGMTDEEAESFRNVALFDIQRHAESHGINSLDQDEVFDVLQKSGAFRRFGISRADAERSVAAHSATDPAAPRTARAVKRPSSEARREEEARKTGERFKRRSARRRAAASSAPKGAGAPTAPAKPPKGMTVPEAIEWRRKQIAASRRG